MPRDSNVTRLPAVRQSTQAGLAPIVNSPPTVQSKLPQAKQTTNILSQSMKVKDAVVGKKKLTEVVEESKNAPSATSDSQSQGGESSQQDKKEKTRKKINP